MVREAIRWYPPPPTPPESLAGRGVHKSAPAKSRRQSSYSQNQENTGVASVSDLATYTVSASTRMGLFFVEGKIGCHTEVVDSSA